MAERYFRCLKGDVFAVPAGSPTPDKCSCGAAIERELDKRRVRD